MGRNSNTFFVGVLCLLAFAIPGAHARLGGAQRKLLTKRAGGRRLWGLLKKPSIKFVEAAGKTITTLVVANHEPGNAKAKKAFLHAANNEADSSIDMGSGVLAYVAGKGDHASELFWQKQLAPVRAGADSCFAALELEDVANKMVDSIDADTKSLEEHDKTARECFKVAHVGDKVPNGCNATLAKTVIQATRGWPVSNPYPGHPFILYKSKAQDFTSKQGYLSKHGEYKALTPAACAGWCASFGYQQHQPHSYQQLQHTCKVALWMPSTKSCRIMYEGGLDDLTPFYFHDKKPEGAICTYTPDCQGNLECYAAEMVGPIQVSRCQKSEVRRIESQRYTISARPVRSATDQEAVMVLEKYEPCPCPADRVRKLDAENLALQKKLDADDADKKCAVAIGNKNRKTCSKFLHVPLDTSSPKCFALSLGLGLMSMAGNKIADAALVETGYTELTAMVQATPVCNGLVGLAANEVLSLLRKALDKGMDKVADLFAKSAHTGLSGRVSGSKANQVKETTAQILARTPSWETNIEKEVEIASRVIFAFKDFACGSPVSAVMDLIEPIIKCHTGCQKERCLFGPGPFIETAEPEPSDDDEIRKCGPDWHHGQFMAAYKSLSKE